MITKNSASETKDKAVKNKLSSKYTNRYPPGQSFSQRIGGVFRHRGALSPQIAKPCMISRI
jgi:hypothetical protein